jgi:23S rRNA (cytidine2498-2'-O)-methyltransferase
VATLPGACTALLAYCRAGFEKEAASELSAHANRLAVAGYVKAKAGAAYVLFVAADAAGLGTLAEGLRFEDLVFCRQILFAGDLSGDLPVADRATPLVARVKDFGQHFSALVVEMPDTNEGKALSSFCKAFTARFEEKARKAGIFLDARRAAPRLHLFFLSGIAAYVGISHPANSSPWPSGIARVRVAKGAPSRSAGKLAEAFMVFIGNDAMARRVAPGMTAVDLGAAPGGWSSILARNNLTVVAVDNGDIDQALLDTGQVKHRRMDGFDYRPAKAVDWMVCDMVEKPALVAALVAKWAGNRWCRECIFNLKLPMKKRYEELDLCRARIAGKLEGLDYELRFRHLYHDREEVTGHLRLLG